MMPTPPPPDSGPADVRPPEARPPDPSLLDPVVRLVATPDELAAIAAVVETAPQVAIDVEANGLHAYRERVCVLQLTAGATNAIVDVVALEDLSPLRDALDRDDVEIVFHGGDYDVSILSRDHDFRFHRVFDTMIAATLLGEEKVGLADLVESLHGVRLDKRYQKMDWEKRPLDDDQIDYLHRDTIYLPSLRDLYYGRLAEADLLEEAAIEFDRLAERCGKIAELDPEGWRRIKGARGLPDVGRSILAEIYLWREGESERRDRPPFKVLPPSVMVDLAKNPPPSEDAPQDLRVVPPRLRPRYGADIAKSVRAGIARAAEGRAPPAEIGPKPTPAERAKSKRIRRLDEKLRDWRKDEAKERKVTNLVVIPNRAIAWIARARPRTVAELAEYPDIGKKRAARYGETILEIVAKA